MPLSFEVKETDLLGRIGVLSAGGKKVETPCLFPVIHPVRQAVTVGELRDMGFAGLMTNSYIIYKRRREEALRDGIHRMLGFDGMLMTDSGGYQVLEYGDLGLKGLEVASFQAEIGSDLAVTLDRPTGHPQSRRVARDTVEYSLSNAIETMERYGGSRTTWVGPIQGGLHLDLVRKSAAALSGAGFEALALGSPVQVMENYMFRDLVRMVVAARKAVPYSLPLHLFGAGHPLTMALAVALGCDTFDSASYILFARNGRYMSESGVLALETMRYFPCSCPVCSGTTPKEMRELDRDDRVRRLSIHNLHSLRRELESCKEAISEGRLWDLVEERSCAHPRLREAFAELVTNSRLLAAGTPAMKERGLFIRGEEDLSRPEMLQARERLSRVTRVGKKRAVLAPEGEPLRYPRWYGRESAAEGADIYRLSRAFGAFPAELAFVYPFTQTVCSESLTEARAEEAAAELKGRGYRRVEVLGGPEKRKPRSIRSRRGASPSPRSASARSR